MKLEIRDISKTYANGVRALDGVSLSITEGMFGLLGPNGAGKTTLMRTIATLQEPDEGTIRFGDIDVLKQKEDVRRILGYLPQDFGLYPSVTAESLLSHLATLKGVTNPTERSDMVEALLRRVGLWDVRKKRLGGFSGGMTQRFGVAQALIGDPQLVIVDEPTAGLDPEERTRFLNHLAEIGESVVVILSTHIVEDVSEVCTQMAIISEGRVLHAGDPRAALEAMRGRVWTKTVSKSELPGLRERARVLSTRLRGGASVVHVESDAAPGDGFVSAEPDLKDVYFMTIGGDQLEDGEGADPLAVGAGVDGASGAAGGGTVGAGR